MPEPDQTLSRETLAITSRWWNIQKILDEFHTEREAQYTQWGRQEIPLGFGTRHHRVLADQYREECDEAAACGDLTLAHILKEEFFEVLAESDMESARDELVQVGACIVQAIERIDALLMERAGA